MVTGLEIAGLVLASFPIAVTGIQAIRKGIEPLRIWRNYRSEFLALQTNVAIQQELFENNMELLLDNIVTSSSLMSRLLRSPGGPEWKDVDIAEKLERTLSKSYVSYLVTVTRMKETLEELETQLGLVAGEVTPNSRYALTIQVPWLDKSTSGFQWKGQLKRIKLTLLKEDWKQNLKDLERGNENLRRLRGDSSKLVSGRARRNVKIPQSWTDIRERAASLDALTRAWQCECEVVHYANLLIDDSTWDEEANFKIWFCSAMCAEGIPQGVPWDQHHAKVFTIPLQPLKDISIPEPIAGSKDAPLREDQVNRKSLQTMKNWLQSKK
jgi:hypothetical protein